MQDEGIQLELRALQKEDYPQLEALMNEVYDEVGGAWPEDVFFTLVEQFPDGQIGITDEGKLVAIALTVQVDYARFSNPHRYDDLIGLNKTIAHNAQGDVLYGLDILISKSHRGHRLGRRLYDARKELCRALNLRGIIAGGRIPNYHRYADEMSPQTYIAKVSRKEIYDPILTFQLSNDFQVKRVLHKYLPEDQDSLGYATLLEWSSLFYAPPSSPLQATKEVVRVGTIQWQMREVASVDALLRQVEYFVDALSSYQSDFAIFPEFFNAPLMGLTDQSDQHKAVRFLANYTDTFVTAMSRLAISYNINIVTGSMPVLEGDRLFNVSHLCHRDGQIESQRKIHITPHERRDWVIEGGDQLRVFETDAGRVAILICYDIEFPELSRLLAAQQVDMIFVPFWTDTKNGHLRVKLCAQARAVENECYVITAGSVGNLPSVENLDLQYAQSAVYTPSDFIFSHDALLAEATPNSEMLLFADLDLRKLKQLRGEGSVNNWRDRRTDLYQLNWIGPEPQPGSTTGSGTEPE